MWEGLHYLRGSTMIASSERASDCGVDATVDHTVVVRRQGHASRGIPLLCRPGVRNNGYQRVDQ